MYVQFKVSTKIHTTIQGHLDTHVFLTKCILIYKITDETYCHDFYPHNYHSNV